MIELSAVDSVEEQSRHMRRAGLDAFQVALRALREARVAVVFCCDRVDEQALFAAANHGVYVVRRLSL